MEYKAIVIDLDGTLTNDAKEITPRVKETLLAAQERGVKVILASGRPTYGIRQLADELKVSHFGGFVLAYNGGCIIDWNTKETIYNTILDETLVPELYEAARASGCEILTYQGDVIATTSVKNKYVMHEAFINKMPLIQYDDFLGQVIHPINKCLIVGDPKVVAALEKTLGAKMEGRMNVYRSAGFFLECVPLGIDKATSLDFLLSRIGIGREETIAVGDGYNDLSMLRFAGLGVAMANAAREVLDEADYVTYSNQEDGVAHVVEKFILNTK